MKQHSFTKTQYSVSKNNEYLDIRETQPLYMSYAYSINDKLTVLVYLQNKCYKFFW